MDHDALRQLQDTVSRLGGPDDAEAQPAGVRANEPDAASWHPTGTEVQDCVVSLWNDEAGERTTAYLNLDELVGAKESGQIVLGLDAVAGNLWGTAEGRDRERLREAMATGCRLPRETVDTLCDGPNWIGDARARVSPQQVIEAIRRARDGRTGNDIWDHLDRREIVRLRDAEPRDWYAERRFEHAYEREHAGSSAWPGEARERELREAAERPEHRIAGDARIDPSARIARQVTIDAGAVVGAGTEVVAGTHVRAGTAQAAGRAEAGE